MLNTPLEQSHSLNMTHLSKKISFLEYLLLYIMSFNAGWCFVIFAEFKGLFERSHLLSLTDFQTGK